MSAYFMSAYFMSTYFHSLNDDCLYEICKHLHASDIFKLYYVIGQSIPSNICIMYMELDNQRRNFYNYFLEIAGEQYNDTLSFTKDAWKNDDYTNKDYNKFDNLCQVCNNKVVIPAFRTVDIRREFPGQNACVIDNNSTVEWTCDGCKKIRIHHHIMKIYSFAQDEI